MKSAMGTVRMETEDSWRPHRTRRSPAQMKAAPVKTQNGKRAALLSEALRPGALDRELLAAADQVKEDTSTTLGEGPAWDEQVHMPPRGRSSETRRPHPRLVPCAPLGVGVGCGGSVPLPSSSLPPPLPLLSSSPLLLFLSSSSPRFSSPGSQFSPRFTPPPGSWAYGRCVWGDKGNGRG